MKNRIKCERFVRYKGNLCRKMKKLKESLQGVLYNGKLNLLSCKKKVCTKRTDLK